MGTGDHQVQQQQLQTGKKQGQSYKSNPILYPQHKIVNTRPFLHKFLLPFLGHSTDHGDDHEGRLHIYIGGQTCLLYIYTVGHSQTTTGLMEQAIEQSVLLQQTPNSPNNFINTHNGFGLTS